MPRRRLGWTAVFASIACAPAPAETGEIETIELRLTESTADGCSPEDYARIYTLSVTVYGQSGNAVDDLCIDGPRCIFVDALQSLEDVEVALADERSPLVEVPAEGARLVAVHGHEGGCFSYSDPTSPLPVLCGLADLGSAEDGAIDVLLKCACERPPVQICE